MMYKFAKYIWVKRKEVVNVIDKRNMDEPRKGKLEWSRLKCTVLAAADCVGTRQNYPWLVPLRNF